MRKKTVFLTFLAFLSLTAKAQELRTGAQESEPKYYRSGDKIIGLCIDVLRGIEKVEPKLRFTGDQSFVPFKRIEYNVESGIFDCFAGFAKTAERENAYVFIDIPLYLVRDVLVVLKDDPVGIDRLEDIKSLPGSRTIIMAMGVVQAVTLRSKGYDVDDSEIGRAHG